MPTWILIVAALSVVATAGLTWVLHRINPPERRSASPGGDPGLAASEGGGRRLQDDGNDGNSSDATGSADGGGD